MWGGSGAVVCWVISEWKKWWCKFFKFPGVEDLLWDRRLILLVVWVCCSLSVWVGGDMVALVVSIVLLFRWLYGHSMGLGLINCCFWFGFFCWLFCFAVLYIIVCCGRRRGVV